ncbi:hypothetical protein FACS18942_10830 [Planctomycetales bacterium]|nr:hypothetical protein FACS18942_10830 [Planctomycetales bacterium]
MWVRYTVALPVAVNNRQAVRLSIPYNGVNSKCNTMFRVISRNEVNQNKVHRSEPVNQSKVNRSEPKRSETAQAVIRPVPSNIITSSSAKKQEDENVLSSATNYVSGKIMKGIGTITSFGKKNVVSSNEQIPQLKNVQHPPKPATIPRSGFQENHQKDEDGIMQAGYIKE